MVKILYRKNDILVSSRVQRLGASAVEFAVVAPLFFMIVIGMIEFGRMMMLQQLITNAAREGARIAILDSATSQRVNNKVEDYLKAGNITGAQVKINPNPPSNAGFDQPVSVSVSVPMDSNSWLPSQFFLGGKTLKAEAVMRSERVE